MDEGLDYAISLLSKFYSKARCPPYARALWSCSDQGVWLREGEPSCKAFQILLFIRLFFLSISLVWLLGCICNGSIMVVWAFLFCVANDAYWRVLLRFGLWHTCAPNFVSFILFVYAD